MILIWCLIFINQNIEKLSRDQNKIRIEQLYFEYMIFMHVSPNANIGSHPSYPLKKKSNSLANVKHTTVIER